jgi:hypothetical protein
MGGERHLWVCFVELWLLEKRLWAVTFGKVALKKAIVGWLETRLKVPSLPNGAHVPYTHILLLPPISSSSRQCSSCREAPIGHHSAWEEARRPWSRRGEARRLPLRREGFVGRLCAGRGSPPATHAPEGGPHAEGLVINHARAGRGSPAATVSGGGPHALSCKATHPPMDQDESRASPRWSPSEPGRG